MLTGIEVAPLVHEVMLGMKARHNRVPKKEARWPQRLVEWSHHTSPASAPPPVTVIVGVLSFAA